MVLCQWVRRHNRHQEMLMSSTFEHSHALTQAQKSEAPKKHWTTRLEGAACWEAGGWCLWQDLILEAPSQGGDLKHNHPDRLPQPWVTEEVQMGVLLRNTRSTRACAELIHRSNGLQSRNNATILPTRGLAAHLSSSLSSRWLVTYENL